MAGGPELLLNPAHGLGVEFRGLFRESAALLMQLGAQAAAARPQTAETSRTRQFFGMTGLAVRAVPCLSGNRNGLDSLNAYPPLRRKSAACGAAAAGAACSFARAASTL